YGACPTCKGLGSVYQISMDAIIPDRELSINEGGIAPLGEERENFIFGQVQKLARKEKFSLDTPIKDLPKRALNIVLYGTEKEPEEEILDFDTIEKSDNIYWAEFEGVVTQLKRWFAGSSSDAFRAWVEEFMELKPCGTCGGARLKKESLWFKVAEK